MENFQARTGWENKDQSYSAAHAHFCQDWAALTKGSTARDCRLPDQLWALLWASISFFLPHPPSLRNMYTDFSWVFERSVVLKRLTSPKWAGPKPTRWGEALVTRAQNKCAVWPFGLCFEMPLCRVLISYLVSHVLAHGYRRRKSCSQESWLWD